MKRMATVILHLDLTDNDLPNSFWEGYFKALAATLSPPTTANVSISDVSFVEKTLETFEKKLSTLEITKDLFPSLERIKTWWKNK